MGVLWWALAGVALFLVAGNLAIFLAHLTARRRSPPRPASWGHGAENAHEVTSTLWRSGRPSPATYTGAAEAGAVAVIDLRAEAGDGPDPALGLDYHKLPMRDGQAPTLQTLDEFRKQLDSANGTVLVHCSAGVGRTGSMMAARQVLDEGAHNDDALRGMLAVGPPSFEQIDFVRGLPQRLRPARWAVVVSRTLDAPRRTWSRIRSLR